MILLQYKNLEHVCYGQNHTRTQMQNLEGESLWMKKIALGKSKAIQNTHTGGLSIWWMGEQPLQPVLPLLQSQNHHQQPIAPDSPCCTSILPESDNSRRCRSGASCPQAGVGRRGSQLRNLRHQHRPQIAARDLGGRVQKQVYKSSIGCIWPSKTHLGQGELWQRGCSWAVVPNESSIQIYNKFIQSVQDVYWIQTSTHPPRGSWPDGKHFISLT